MSDLICVTNRLLCREDFPERIEKIAACSPAGIILREKDLSAGEYRMLAAQILRICDRYGVPCILHSFWEEAAALGVRRIHLPLPLLRRMDARAKACFSLIGASCHSVPEAREAQELGCTYITAGHIFVTDCKKGLAPRGIPFLREIIRNVSIPVYAIGGVDSGSVGEVREAGAAGACVMSGLMQCEDVKEFFEGFSERPVREPAGSGAVRSEEL